MKVLVCGGRDYQNVHAVNLALHALHEQHRITAIVEGGANGADHWARRWAESNGIHLTTVHADWKAHGRAAGPMRNALMLAEHRPDVVVAFPGGAGTADMVRRAKADGIPVLGPYRARDQRAQHQDVPGLAPEGREPGGEATRPDPHTSHDTGKP